MFNTNPTQPPYGVIPGTSLFVPSTNLPAICIYLKLAAEYYDPNAQAYVYPSLETYFTPLAQLSGQQDYGAGPTNGFDTLPLCAPILLPVERAVSYMVRGSYTNVGFNVQTDPTKYALIDYIVSASQ